MGVEFIASPGAAVRAAAAGRVVFAGRRAGYGTLVILDHGGRYFTVYAGLGEVGVRVGDILSFYASLTRIGRTSVTVQVEVYAEQFRTQGTYVKVTEASLTYVAIDDNGRPRPIPKP